jgi:hypothetical protein
MRNVSQRIAFACLVIFAFIPVHALAAFIDQPVELTLDMDDDGTADRAVIVPDPESTDIDLSIYLGVGYGKLAPWGKPSFQRQGFPLDWPLLAVERKGKASLVITSGCGGCSNDYSTTLTIVYRGGEFLVGGYTYEWETRDSAGTCDIDFLTGKGTLLEGIEGEGKPLAGTFAPVKLADWSDETRPKECDLPSEN